jgi:hypothetical protein
MSDASQGVCPACRRYVGAASVCPYCELTLPGGIRFLRGGVLLITLLGCLYVGLLARHHPVSTLQAVSITPWMQGAYVSLTGTVTRAPGLVRGVTGRQRLVFALNDGTGRVNIVCPDGVAQRLIIDGELPQKKDRVAVQGTLELGFDGAVSVRCRAADAIRALPDVAIVEHRHD